MKELDINKINEYSPYHVILDDEEDNENYAALIIRRDNPKFNDLVTEFTNTVTLLNNKPRVDD